jgi:hypothetical protein
VPLLILASFLPWLIARDLASPLFRDATQNQYMGWCTLHRVTLYRDAGEPDAPLIFYLHAAIQLVGGITDAACRRVDLAFHVLGAAAMGALLAPRPPEATRAERRSTLLLWTCLGVVLWLGWYLCAGWKQTVQRDPYYALLGYLGLVLLHTSAERRLEERRRAIVEAAAGGVLLTLLVFSRHSGIIFPACGALGFVLAEGAERRLRRPRAAAAAIAAAVTLPCGVISVALLGSLRWAWFWYVRFAFGFYQWMGKKGPIEVLFGKDEGPFMEALAVALVVTVGVFAATRARLLPRRTWAFAASCVLFLVAACAVGKGWPNHVQQATAATVPLALIALAKLRSATGRWSAAQRGGAMVLGAFAVYRVAWMIIGVVSPLWSVGTEDLMEMASASAVADFLRTRTPADGTVFLYGHDLNVLLRSERRTAVPYLVNMTINTEGWYSAHPAEEGHGPDPRQRKVMLEIQEQIAADTWARLSARAPDAIVVLDESLGQFHRGLAELAVLFPGLPAMLRDRFAEVQVPGAARYHVFLRLPSPS